MIDRTGGKSQTPLIRDAINLAGIAGLAVGFGAALPSCAPSASEQGSSTMPLARREGLAATLKGHAYLPADSFFPGPPSGALLSAGADTNQRVVPFRAQPIQGISAAILEPDGSLLVLVDNGYGRRNNSADALLRLYNVTIDHHTASGGSGTVQVHQAITLRDPKRVMGVPIIADLSHYPKNLDEGSFPGVLTTIPVADEIRTERILTGADLDPESFRRAPDGTLWIAEEFGPFLLHFDRDGVLLRKPFNIPIPQSLSDYGKELKTFRSPDNPALQSLPTHEQRLSAANLPRSKGVEGMAISADGKKLFLMIEGPLRADVDQHRLAIVEFDLEREEFTGRAFFYRMEQPHVDAMTPHRNKIGELVALNDRSLLVVETDDGQGVAGEERARFKKIFRIDLETVNKDGFLAKNEIVDLLAISNPKRIVAPDARGRIPQSDPFTFPFMTIETAVVLGKERLLIITDNNFPTKGGNGRTSNDSDGTEFIELHVPKLSR